MNLKQLTIKIIQLTLIKISMFCSIAEIQYWNKIFMLSEYWYILVINHDTKKAQNYFIVISHFWQMGCIKIEIKGSLPFNEKQCAFLFRKLILLIWRTLAEKKLQYTIMVHLNYQMNYSNEYTTPRK